MPLNPNIILAGIGQPSRPFSLGGSLAEIMKMRGDAQQAQEQSIASAQTREMNAQTMEHNRFTLDEARSTAAEDDAYKQAIVDNAHKTPADLEQAIRTTAPGHLATFQKSMADLQDKVSTAKKADADAAVAHTKALEGRQGYIGDLADHMAKSDYNPTIVNAGLNDAVAAFPEWAAKADEIRQIGATQGRAALQLAIQSLIPGSTTKANAETAHTAAETATIEAARPGVTADAAGKVQIAANMHDGMTAEQQAVNALGRTNAATSRGQLAVAQQNHALAQQRFGATIGSGLDDQGHPLPVDQLKAVAQADRLAVSIAENRVPPVSARSMASGAGKTLMEHVMLINPDYDAVKFPQRSKMAVAFTSGPQSQTLNSLNTAIEHLDQFVGFTKDMGNGNVQAANQLTNWIKTQYGDSAPTNFDGMKSVLSGEIASALKKSGATDQEIASVERSMTSKSSPTQLVDYATKVVIPALGSKAHTYDAQWKATMGEKDPFSVYTPGAKAVLEKYGALHGSAGAPADTANRAAPPPAARVAAPAPAAGLVEMIAPNGKPVQVPADQVAEAMRRGATRPR